MVNKEELKQRIRVAMGQQEADLVLTNGKLVSTFTEEILPMDIAICNGRIAAIEYVDSARETVDLQGAYICPAFIDAHIHIESSMLTPEGFAEAVVPHGTGVTISDPHEIANVFGIKGLQYMLSASRELPLDILYGIPSCVPATNMETSGGALQAQDIKVAHQINPHAPALGEMMNYPGVYTAMDDVLDKICTAQQLGLVIDGHSPMLKGRELNGYLNAFIATDHECMCVDEAMDKLRRGMYVLLRQGSAARNLQDLVSVISDKTAHRICIATDDRHPDHLLEHGHLDSTWRQLISMGVDPIRALRLMTLNPALVYRLHDRGGLGIGYRADFFITDDLQQPVVKMVYHNGIKVAENGKLLKEIPRHHADDVVCSVHLPTDLHSKLQKFPKTGKVRVIGIIEGQLVTENLCGRAEDVAESDLAYLAVVERHAKNANVGLGFVRGLGLQAGALASTVAHDHHNLILAGKTLADMELAAQTAENIGGGFVVVKQGQILASLALPVGGIMSLDNVHVVSSSLHRVDRMAKELGVMLDSPFMVLSFLALSVIPHLKLTDIGIVDVDQFQIVPLDIV